MSEAYETELIATGFGKTLLIDGSTRLHCSPDGRENGAVVELVFPLGSPVPEAHQEVRVRCIPIIKSEDVGSGSGNIHTDYPRSRVLEVLS